MWKHAITRKREIGSKANLACLYIYIYRMPIYIYIQNHCSTVNTNHHDTFYDQKYHIKGQTILKSGYSSDHPDNSVHSPLSKMDTLGGNSYSWLIITCHLCNLIMFLFLSFIFFNLLLTSLSYYENLNMKNIEKA